MSRERSQAKSLFLQAVESYTADQWPQFLDDACGGDAQLRQRVEELLKAHQGKDSLLDQSAPEPAATVASPTRSSPSGTRIGPYRLLQEIGEGGMGVVYMAEQTHPVQRKVALKLIKPGLDNRQVIARFEAERQALALMDHPNIAKVLDAGTTNVVRSLRDRDPNVVAPLGDADLPEQGAGSRSDPPTLADTGQPYFVMELVNGVPLTRYCDERRLPPRQRLELFVQVCQAVQHAHQKGIIHRDLKPSNVLVAQYDGKPVPKVIDFGVAKATGSKLTDKTMFTEFGSIVGTLEYMSPEQAERNQIDVDTRSDIYSLGVLLYELLTGTTPLDKKRLKSAAFLELLRIIQQEEPQKPSTRVSTADELPSIAANRSLEPRKLSGMMRGELDWIVMKALDKERSRRYETANGFAADVLRFLHDEPVAACPPSTLYRFRKFARRNKALLTTGTIVATALVVATAFSTWQASVATRARNQERIRAESESKARAEAEDARNRERTLRVEADAQRHRAETSEAKARSVVDEYLVKVTDDELLKVPGMQPLRRDLLRSGLRFYEEFLQQREDDPRLTRELAATRLRVGRINSELGAVPEARAALDASIAAYESLLAEQPDAADLKAELADAWRAIGELYWEQNVVEALRGYERAAEIGTQLVEAQPDNMAAKRALAKALNGLGVMQAKSQQGTAALASHERCLELREELIQLDPDDATLQHAVGESLHNVATLLGSAHQRAALDLLQRSNRYNRLACERLPHVIEYGIDLGTNYAVMADAQWRLGEREEAVASYRKGVQHLQAMSRAHPAVPAVHSHLVTALRSLAQMQSALGHATDAERSLQQASDSIERLPIETAEDLYVLACVRGACVASLADLKEQSQQELLAVETLQKAVDKGFRDVARLKQESAFARLREREPFQNLLSNLETKLEADSLVAGARDSTDASLQAHSRAAELRKKLADANPTNRRIQADFAASRQAVGLIQMEQGRLDEAAQSLDEARHVREALVRDEPGNLQFRADLAASLFSQAKLDRQANRLTDVFGDWEAGLALFDTAGLEESPTAEWQNQVANAELDYAQFLAGAGLYEEAAQHLARGYRRTPPSAAVWRIHACMRLFVRDEAGNLAACRELLEQFGMASSQLYLVAIACSLGSPPVGDVNRWCQVMDEYAKANEGKGRAALYSGLALYRAERYQEAIRELQKDGRAASFPVVAMACHRLGKDDEAHYWLKRARDWYEQTVRAGLEGTLELTLGGLYVWDRPQFLVNYREAEALIEGVEAPHPWLDLWQARIYSGYGQKAKAQEHFQAAVTARPADPALWLARARVFANLGDQAQAEADFARAIDLSGDDPAPWIARGRYFAERGDQEKADADFAKAASLTPDNLDRFFEAGWWVAGPFLNDMAIVCGPENSLDPSRPIDGAAGNARPGDGAAEQVVHWRSLPTGAFGRVDLSTLFPGNNVSSYALTYVYSPRDQQVELLWGNNGSRRVWVNGELAGEASQPMGWEYNLGRVRLPLRAGRNTILVKTNCATGSSGYHLWCRLSGNPTDRAWDALLRGNYQEAARLLPQVPERDRDHTYYQYAAFASHYVGDETQYRSLCEFMAFRYGWTRNSPHPVVALCASWGLGDLTYPDPIQWNECTEVIRKQAATDAWCYYWLALAELRAGKNAEVLADLACIPVDLDQKVMSWPIAAIAHSRLGDKVEASRWLQKADEWYAQALPAALTSGTIPSPAYYWVAFISLYREAKVLIEGKSPDLQASLDGIELQSHLKRDDRAGADILLSRIVERAPDLSQNWISRARFRIAQGRFQEAEADLTKAVAINPADPVPLIARGRFFAERGAQEQADADYARAATLTSEELNRFLEGGWWVAGPYPPGLEQFCPPELDPDPSRPVHVVDDKGILSDQPVPWRPVSSNAMGQVRMSTLPGIPQGSSFYAMTHVYSPDDRTATLWGDPNVRVWVNGKLLDEPTAPGAWHWGGGGNHRLPIVLHQGRNTILLKMGARELFAARLGDHPLDRALEYYRFGLFAEAAETLHAASKSRGGLIQWLSEEYLHRFYVISQLVEGNLEEYRRSSRESAARFEMSTNLYDMEELATICTSGPDGLEPERLAKVITAWKQQRPLERKPWLAVSLGLAEYRMGQIQDAITACEAVAGDVGACVVLAMAHHQLGHEDEAATWLQKARGPIESTLDNAQRPTVDYVEWPYLYYREACQLIQGDSADIEQRYAMFRATRRKMWAEREPATADFLDAVRAAGDQPQVYLARGKRLAELERWEEAETDFNKAVELQPDSPDVRAARAFFYADRGELDRAVADLKAAYEAFPDSRPRWFEGQGIDWQLAGHDEFFARMTDADGLNNHYWVIRMIRMLYEGRLEEARIASQSLERLGGFENMLAAAALAMSDTETFTRVCKQAVEKLDDTPGTRWALVECLTIAPVPPTLAEKVLTASEQLVREQRVGETHACGWRGLAHYRKGEYAEAITEMEEAITAERGSWHRAPYLPALAMANYRAGHPETARLWLARSERLLDYCQQAGPDRSGQIINPRSLPPGVWLQLYVLHREARALIDGQSRDNGQQPVDVEKRVTPVSN